MKKIVVFRFCLFVPPVQLIRVTHMPGKKQTPIFILRSPSVAQKFSKLFTTLAIILYLLFV